MKVRIELEPGRSAPEAVIYTDRVTDEVESAVRSLRAEPVRAQDDAGLRLIRTEDIIRFFAEHQKVYCETAEGSFVVKERLYEWELRLDERRFVRISKSEIVNARKIIRLDASISGTIVVILENGSRTYTSRRYVPKIRKIFGL